MLDSGVKSDLGLDLVPIYCLKYAVEGRIGVRYWSEE